MNEFEDEEDKMPVHRRVTISDLSHSKFTLKNPIELELTDLEDSVVARYKPANVGSSGDHDAGGY